MTYGFPIANIEALPSQTVPVESDLYIIESGGAKKKIRKDSFHLLATGTWTYTSGLYSNTLATTFTANNTPTPVLMDSWATSSGTALVNMTQSNFSNRRTLEVSVPSGASTSLRHKFLLSGGFTVVKSGGGQSNFNLRIFRDGVTNNAWNSVFTLTDDTTEVFVPVPKLFNSTDGQVHEFYVERLTGTGDVIFKGGAVIATAIKPSNIVS
jgi:hypothetical protein